MYLGGLPSDRTNLILPTELWTAMLNYGYVGCIRDLFIDGRSKDIRQIAEAQNGAGIKPSCNKQTGKQCESYPCKNRGVCKEGWNRFICDCTGTGYWSRTCERGKSSFLFHKPQTLLILSQRQSQQCFKTTNALADWSSKSFQQYYRKSRLQALYRLTVIV